MLAVQGRMNFSTGTFFVYMYIKYVCTSVPCYKVSDHCIRKQVMYTLLKKIGAEIMTSSAQQ